MKKIVLFFALVMVFSIAICDVFITELADPENSSSTGRFVELYNNGDTDVDLSTGWQIQRATNDNDYWQSAVDLTGTITAGGFYIITNNQTYFTNTYGFAADQAIGTGGPADSNGDDQIRLLSPGSVVEDMFGVLGEDGSGTNHEFEDGRAERKATITTGNTTYDFAEWNIWNDSGSAGTINEPQYAPEDFDPGEWIGTADNIPPTISNITQTPENVTSSDAVSVSCEVTDPDAMKGIVNVELHWGTASGSLTNTINMSSTGKAIYSTDTDIPAQSDGVTVYYEIYAEDDGDPVGTNTTSEQSYTVNDPASLPYSESFDNSTWPTGWTYSGFTLEDTNNAGGESYEAELGFWNASPGISHITSPAINTTGETELSLFWKQNLDYYDSGTGADPVIELLTSTDGTNFTSVWTQTVSADETVEKEITLASSEGIGSGTLYIKWFLNSDPDGMLSRWRIDDIYFAGDSPTVIENITNTPASPNSSETVSVSANITDDDGINTVTLNWGTSTGNLPNSINMSSTGKTVYTTDSDIPAHADGTTIYYEVSVVDVNDNTTVSAEQSYYVSDAVGPTISTIYISEVSDEDAGGYQTAYMEIYNNSGNPINMEGCYIERWSDGAYDSYTYTFGSGVLIPAYGVLIVARGANQATFESDWGIDFGTLDAVFDSGNNNLYFTTGRSYKLYSTAKAELDTTPTVESGNRIVQETIGSWSAEESSSNATPGQLDPGQTLPVVLSEFTAVFAGNTPTIYWTTQSETNNSGWNLYRNQVEDFANATCINVELIEGAGTTSEPTNYSYSDLYPITAGETYWYWLESVENNGTTETYGPITLDIPAGSDTPELPQLTSLKGNYPNPFNPQTTIEFTVKEGNTGTLTIYNAKGQVLQSVNVDASMQEYTWDAANYGSGVYFYKLETENYSQIKKMIMLK